MRDKHEGPKLAEILTPPSVFMESYNKGIPSGFPHASIELLKQFQALHPSLFKSGDEWSIDRHRKKLMDWLVSYRQPQMISVVS
ncbi:MAG: hypothetical protein Q8Q39_02470 [bacterium]|nr:hypothetical protein [bacterium]